MGKTANQIETHIERTRDKLGSNIHELEQKVKSATDWRHHFRNSPMTMLGAAFGGGVLLAAMLGSGRRRRSFSPYAEPASRTPHAGTDRQKHRALETWDNIKGALIGVAAARFKDFVGEVVPGFNEQFQHTQAQKNKSLPAAPGSGL
ncbi:MAG: hypothetical protein JO307_12785 [Bryobacterales bacterium]|nr:hypothetical protein [Bryobacterales bacterium]MBV9397743.1 hypothetical protein [Bryobacterales bacterium]